MIEIGKKIETREGIFYELEYNGEGNIYKNEDAFLNRQDEVCYVPEYAAEGHKDWRVPQNENCFTHNSLGQRGGLPGPVLQSGMDLSRNFAGRMGLERLFR